MNTPARVGFEHHHRAGNRLAHRPKHSGSPVDRALGPVSWGALIGDGSQPFPLFLGYLLGRNLYDRTVPGEAQLWLASLEGGHYFNN